MKKSRDKLETETNEKMSGQKIPKNKRDTIVELTKAALLTALFCVLAPHTLYLPFSPIGITFGSFLLYLTGMLLGPKFGCISIFLYLCMGFMGLPVFSGYTAGAGVLFGPTGGFLLGYLLCVVAVGLFTKKAFGGKKGILSFVGGMFVGTVALYVFGTLWFVFVYAGTATFGEAVTACVVPFLPFDAVKMVLAAVLYKPLLRVIAQQRPV